MPTVEPDGNTAAKSDSTKRYRTIPQIIFGIVVFLLIADIFYVLIRVSGGELNEKRNINLTTVDNGFASRRSDDTTKMNMADEYDRWFADLYRPSSVLSSSKETEINTSTASYLRYGLQSQSKIAWARAMFPAHLNVQRYKIITVQLTDLPEWQQRVVGEAPDAFHNEIAEIAKSAHGFGVQYDPDVQFSQVRRAGLRMRKSTVQPSGTEAPTDKYSNGTATLQTVFDKFVTKTPVYRTKSIKYADYTPSMKQNTISIENITSQYEDFKKKVYGRVPGPDTDQLFDVGTDSGYAPKYIVKALAKTPTDMQYYFEHDEDFDNILSMTSAMINLRSVFLDKTILDSNIAKFVNAHYFPIVNASGDGSTHYYSFEEVVMYETPVPSCKTGDIGCAPCMRLDGEDALLEEAETQCRDNFELLMGLSGTNDLYLHQCNKDKRDAKPGIVWPMYAWTLNLLTLPDAYLTKITRDETEEDKKIHVAVQEKGGKELKIGNRISIGKKLEEAGNEINVMEMDLATRRAIVSGMTYATVADEEKRNVCLADTAPTVELNEMGQCVAHEGFFRDVFVSGGVLALFVGVLIYAIFGLFFYGVFGNIARIWEIEWGKYKFKLNPGEDRKWFILQWFSHTRQRSELVEFCIGDKSRGLEWGFLDFVLFVITFVLHICLLVVLAHVTVFINEVGPTCGSDNTVALENLEAMYTLQGRKDQLYVKNVFGIFFLVTGWVFFVAIGIGILVNLVELGLNMRAVRMQKNGSRDTNPNGGGSVNNVYVELPGDANVP